MEIKNETRIIDLTVGQLVNVGVFTLNTNTPTIYAKCKEEMPSIKQGGKLYFLKKTL